MKNWKRKIWEEKSRSFFNWSKEKGLKWIKKLKVDRVELGLYKSTLAGKKTWK